MSTQPTRISQGPTSRDVVTPIETHARDALHAVLGSRQRKLDTDWRLMPRGVERC